MSKSILWDTYDPMFDIAFTVYSTHLYGKTPNFNQKLIIGCHFHVLTHTLLLAHMLERLHPCTHVHTYAPCTHVRIHAQKCSTFALPSSTTNKHSEQVAPHEYLPTSTPVIVPIGAEGYNCDGMACISVIQ